MAVSRVAAVVVLVAVLAAASVGVAFAYTTITNSTDNSLSTESYIVAKDSHGDTSIQIPAVRYLKAGTGVYLPEQEGTVIEGTLEVKGPSDTSKMRMWITMHDPMSWTVIQKITLIVDYDKESRVEKTCFDWGDISTTPQSGAATDVIPLADGTHTFRIIITYKGSLTVDPNTYSQNLQSAIMFVQGSEGNDPLIPPSP